MSCQDPVGKEFWKAQLPGKERCSWDRFRDALCVFHQLPVENTPSDIVNQLLFLQATIFLFLFVCLTPPFLSQHLLAERKPNAPKDSPPDVVTLDGFGRLLQWFGPMGKRPDWLRVSERGLLLFCLGCV